MRFLINEGASTPFCSCGRHRGLDQHTIWHLDAAIIGYTMLRIIYPISAQEWSKATRQTLWSNEKFVLRRLRFCPCWCLFYAMMTCSKPIPKTTIVHAHKTWLISYESKKRSAPRLETNKNQLLHLQIASGKMKMLVSLYAGQARDQNAQIMWISIILPHPERT
eukprot:869941-Amphidinium_carterae.1